MIHRTFKLRRVTAAAVLGLGMTAGVIGVTAGTAGATTPTSTATVHATTSKSILSTDTAQPAGNFYVTLPGLKTYTTCKLTVTAVAPSGTLTWKTHPTVTLIKTGVTTATHPTAATATHVLTITVPTIAATVTNVKFTVSANTYTITGSKPGPVKINPALGTCATPASDVAATGFAGHTTVHNATVVSPTTGNSIKASSAPKITTTGTNQAAGNLSLTIRNDTGATIAKTTSYIDLTAHPTTSGDIGWNSATLTSSGVTVKNTTTLPTVTPSTTAVIDIELTSALTAGATATITLKTVSYNTVTAKGTVKVTPVWTTVAGTLTYGAFTPSSAVNAVATVATPPGSPATAVEATSTPNLALTGTGQKAGTWTVTLGGTANAKTKGWAKTESIAITVAKFNGNNCTTSGSGYVVFTGTPTAKVSASTGASVAPTFTVTTTHGAECTGLNKSELVITFTNTGKFTKATGSATIVVSGIKYDTKAGIAATVGNVSVDYAFRAAGTTTAPAAPDTTSSATADGAANASFPLAFVTANTPPVSVSPSAFDASISPVNVVEQATAQIPSGDYVCVSLVQSTNRFNVAATPKASVTSGNGTVASTVAYENGTGGTSTVTSATVAYVRFQVTKASSTTKPSTYSLSGLAVNPSGATGTTVTALVEYGPSTRCTADANEVGGSTATAEAVAYSIKQTSTQIYGATADATAVKLLENRFPATNTTASGTDCPGGHLNSANTRPVILATTEHYQDALSSQYLASYLNTGTLLTPTAKLSAVTLQALKFEGITQVDVVGGPLVVSTTVVAQLMTTPAYSCGGGSKLTTGGATRFLTVTRIYGQTAVETAKAIAESAPTSHVLAAKFLTAYVGVNTTKGNGAFNDTAGSGSPIPLTSSAVPTAILASTTEFQDAMAASTLSYWKMTAGATAGKSFPILLTNPLGLSAAAKDAIATLGIKQVILMGGQLAVTNSVVTSLTTLGIEVLRVAGHTYTDTATQLAMFEESASGMGLDWDTTTVAVARGNGFTDGLVGADVSGKNLWPELLTTSPTTVGKYLTAFLKAHGGSGTAIDSAPTETAQKISTLEIFGGPLAVSPAVVSQMETDIS